MRNLCWLRQLPEDDIYMVEEIKAIDQALDEQRRMVGLGFLDPFRALFSSRQTMYRFILGGALFFFQNGSGINSINYYSPTVFKSLGLVGTSASLLTTGVFGCVKTVVTLVWLFFLIDRLGRRALLMYGAIAGSLCMWYIGGYIKISDPSAHVHTDPVTGATTGGALTSGGISAIFFFYLWVVS